MTTKEKPEAKTAHFMRWQDDSGNISTGLFGNLKDGTTVVVFAYVDEGSEERTLDDAIRSGYFAS